MTEQIQMKFENPPSPPFAKGGLRGITDQSLTYEEKLLLALLKCGKNNASGVKFLASMMKMSEYELRGMVRHLIMDHGICIGSNTSKYPGYYIIIEPEDLDKNYLSLRRRGIKILMRAAELKKISVEEVFGQGLIEFNDHAEFISGSNEMLK